MKDGGTYVLHMLECAGRIELYTQLGREEFLADTRTQDAVIRNFEIIGEAANRVSTATRRLVPEITWTRVTDFRNVLIHRYEGVDLNLVWKRVEVDLPELHRNLKLLQAKLAERKGR